jgi:dihydrofolate synthase/folylpolyglutamate synthase
MSVALAVSDYPSALAFLFERINYERTSQIPYQSGEFKLDRMRELLRRLGDPHLQVPFVHVAGTKGKGSTASMIAAVLKEAGYRTGLYTSPHLEHIEERFVIDGVACSARELVELTQAVEPIVRAMDDEGVNLTLRGPTFFEITTAMVFVYFARQPVDIAVLEVGLGGRLDSTNVCQPAVSVITSISFDHTRQLGNTLTAIASEKAGIIKPGVPVVSGVVSPEPRDAIARIAAEQGAPLMQRGRDFSANVVSSNDSRELRGAEIVYEETTVFGPRRIDGIHLSLLGEHQVENAATAMAALGVLAHQGWNISDDAIRRGLARTKCAARIEVVSQQPLVVIDTAHNAASMEALCQTLASLQRQPRILVFATSRDKDLAAMVRILLPHFDHLILTKYVMNPRARTIEEALPIVEEELFRLTNGQRPQVHQAAEPLAAWQLARRLASDEALICITGSFFLAAELRPVVAASLSA